MTDLLCRFLVHDGSAVPIPVHDGSAVPIPVHDGSAVPILVHDRICRADPCP